MFAAVLSMFLILYWLPTLIPNGTTIQDQKLLPNQSHLATQEELVNYALSLINIDRQSSNTQNLTLSSTDSAQRHADDMLRNHYFSHWNTQGQKPYVRYTLEGGKGAVEENIAMQSDYIDVKSAIADLEWNMVNNDAASNWRHKETILDPFHNKVNIGIAYDNTNLYLVQDFENDYVEWINLTVSNANVTMKGHITQPGLSIREVGIYLDENITLTTQQLGTAPYNGSYNTGTFIGAAIPPNWQSTEGFTITAKTWSQLYQDISINFNLSPAFTRNGKGIYTLYLLSDSGKCLTTYSVSYLQ